MSKRPRATLHALVVLALFAVIGHNCVAPGHAHAVTSSSAHESETPAADHSHSDGGAVHAASCEAVRSGAASVASPSVLAATPLASVATESVQRRSRVVAAAPVSASPPLYVTHRALLI